MLRYQFGKFLIVLGTVFVTAAGLLYIRNMQEDVDAGASSSYALACVQETIQQKIAADTGRDEPKMTSEVLIDANGYQYIGYLTIPVLKLSLPVMAEWDYNRLKTAPCRHFGSAQTDDLVIAGHNYKQHFANLKNLSAGDAITFTDGNGIVYKYSVQLIEKISPTAVDKVQHSEWDMILYTCTYGGNARLMVGCEKTDTILPETN